jgi:hypothetical protein
MMHTNKAIVNTILWYLFTALGGPVSSPVPLELGEARRQGLAKPLLDALREGIDQVGQECLTGASVCESMTIVNISMTIISLTGASVCESITIVHGSMTIISLTRVSIDHSMTIRF